MEGKQNRQGCVPLSGPWPLRVKGLLVLGLSQPSLGVRRREGGVSRHNLPSAFAGAACSAPGRLRAPRRADGPFLRVPSLPLPFAVGDVLEPSLAPAGHPVLPPRTPCPPRMPVSADHLPRQAAPGFRGPKARVQEFQTRGPGSRRPRQDAAGSGGRRSQAPGRPRTWPLCPALGAPLAVAPGAGPSAPVSPGAFQGAPSVGTRGRTLGGRQR